MSIQQISDNEIAGILIRYGVSITSELCNAIRLYVSVLLFWNQKMSLTTVTDVRKIVRFHFGESMFAASAAGIAKGRLADVGSGAGFPGIPLRMISPNLEVTLIESGAKKVAFLSEIARQLGLNIEVFKGRSESYPVNASDFYFVTSRAVGHLDSLVSWSEKHLCAGGRAIFWGTVGQDFNHLSNGSAWSWSPPVKIPDTETRVLLSGTYLGKG
jgi:16S rRNA (guanine527-N7)-methyltransferase